MDKSLWMRTPLPGYPKLKGDKKTDVLVIGGGLAGLLCAFNLTKAGVDCILVEADKLCQGVTGRTTAKITTQHGLIYGKLLRKYGAEIARGYWEANQTALDRYRMLDGDLETRDSFVYALDSRAKLDGEMDALERLKIPAEYVESVSLPFPVAGAIRFANQAQFDPLRFAGKLVSGLEIYEHTPVRGFHGNRVLTDYGCITAEKIIVATHFPFLNKHGAYFLKLYQQRSYVLALENGPDVGGMYLDTAENGLSLRNAGNNLLLGGGGHRTGKQGEGWNALEKIAREYFPAAKIKARWATQDCMTLDGIPYIGRYGGHTPNLYVASGFNKWGMTSAMVSAMVLTDLVQGKENPYARVFSPQRRIWHPQLFKNALEATVNLLTPTAPRCPHMGCALKWNPRERTWDCPCHGSRFTAEGKLLENPATGDLKKPPNL